MTIRIVIVDDHTVVRQGLRLFLKLEPDFEIVGEASNGRQAVHEVKKLRPDIVIMDIAMPELNGIEATSYISKTCPEAQVIMLSVYDNTEYIFEAFKAGAKGYILKESVGEELVKAIRRVHSGNKYLSKEIANTIVFREKRTMDDDVARCSKNVN